MPPPQNDLIPARAGWNGPEMQPPFNATYETFGPAATAAQVREELAQSVEFSWQATIFLTLSIFLCYLLKLRSEKRRQATAGASGRNQSLEHASENGAETRRAA